MHSWLTKDLGNPVLKTLLTKVVTVMELSEDWKSFKEKLDRIVPAFDETLPLPKELEMDTGIGI